MRADQSFCTFYNVWTNAEDLVPVKSVVLGSIIYNWTIVYKRQSFLKVVIQVIIIDQCNQTTLCWNPGKTLV